MEIPPVHHRYVDVERARVFYREAGPVEAPTVLLLHGFPSGSHQFRRLIDALATRYHVIAPDYPGFGYTEVAEAFTYSFDALADVLERFVQALALERFVMYVFDFGGPVGFRLASRHPELIAGLVVQNANAYEEGLSDMARAMVANRPGVEGAEQRVGEILVLPATRGQHEAGATDPELLDPDAWTLDQHFLDQPGRKQAQIDLALDYHSNLDLYPDWQQWLRRHQPPTLVVWGRGDPFFLEQGAHAYLGDLPDAEVHVLDTGHFALEEKLPEIAPIIARFLDKTSQNTRHHKEIRMKLAIIGASGHLGGAIAREARARGHDVTALGRPTVDITDAASIEQAVVGHDAVVASIQGPDHLVPRGAQALLVALPAAGVDRLMFVGGGGSLEYEPGRRYVDRPDFPAEYLETATDQAKALEILRGSHSAVAWSYSSPPPVDLVPGDKTGAQYRVEASDTPLIDEDGQSRITVGDYVAAIVDALENRSFVQQRFTVAY